jgi:prolyl 4-hydroxylase
MQMLVHFSPELKDWLSQNLARGCAHATVIGSMTAQGFAPPVAEGLVAAFAHALARGDALPDSAVTLEVADDAAPAGVYRSDPPRLAPGHRIRADGRDVDVLMRLARPRIAVLGNVLSAEECAAVITLGAPRLAPSTVVDPGSGADLAAAHRSSEGMFFDLCENALIAGIDRRVSELMGLPHHDFLVPQNDANRASLARSGQRVSTLVMYLNDVPAGGATVFPDLGLEVAPRRGHGVYFDYANAAGQVDHATLHAGAAVELGEKWVLTKWMRARPFVAAGGT